MKLFGSVINPYHNLNKHLNIDVNYTRLRPVGVIGECGINGYNEKYLCMVLLSA